MQQQLLTTQLQSRQKQEVRRVEGTKLDVGLAKCYLNKSLFNEFLAKERVKDIDLFYEIQFEGQVTEDMEEPQAFESERIKLKSMASLLQ